VEIGVEAEGGAGGEGLDGDDVPEVEGDDVGGEEVDVVAGEFAFAAAVAEGGLDLVSAGVEGLGAFDLDAAEAGAGVDGEVVAFAVAPGAEDFVSAAGGLMEEGGFAEFSGALGVFARGDGEVEGLVIGGDGVEKWERDGVRVGGWVGVHMGAGGSFLRDLSFFLLLVLGCAKFVRRGMVARWGAWSFGLVRHEKAARRAGSIRVVKEKGAARGCALRRF